MASEQDVKNESCIYDPDFAVVCSFFENFSSLCGIQSPSTLQLQQMLEDTQFIAPELIDLHIRLMRKAKKNVNPERWQKTLAKFCYYTQPDDCWILEQKGYEHLNYSQRLKFLLTLIGAQFDFNAKFKTDVNKLDVKDLRLQPVGRDKDGNNYWVHLDRETTLKVYKEDLDEEKWELVVQDREGLEKLIDSLMKDKDPNRKLEELAEESESSAEEEEEEEEEVEKQVQEEATKEPEPDMKNESNDNAEKSRIEETGQRKGEADIKKDTSNVEDLSKTDPTPAGTVPKPVVKDDSRKVHFAEKLQQAFNEGPLNKSSLSLISRPRSGNTTAPVKPLDKEAFHQHLQKLDSINMLKPLLTSTEPGEELNPATVRSDLLKAKINQKFSIIKPGLQTDVAKSKLDSPTKTPKPGLKLEQILKSKLAQKLSGAAGVATASTSEGSENSKKTEEKKSVPESCNASDEQPLEKPVKTDEIKPASESSIDQKEPQPLEKIVKTGEMKHASESCTDQEEQLSKICRTEAPNDGDEEIEEPVMLVTGVGNGNDCNGDNCEDDEIEDPVMFVYGVGCGSECFTGNNENDDSSKNVSQTAHLSHKVDNILKPVSEGEANPSTSAGEVTDTEKKKPKLWTIDAICNSDSSKDSKRDNLSQFPNYSFNKDTKPYHSASESYSIFSLTENKDKGDVAAISTNFYFGSNNQNPCFLSPELSPTFRSKSHSVENIVDNVNKKGEAKISKFSAESLYLKTNNINEADKTEKVPEVSFNREPPSVPKEEPNCNRNAESTHATEPVVLDRLSHGNAAEREENLSGKAIDHSSPHKAEETVREYHISSAKISKTEEIVPSKTPIPTDTTSVNSAKDKNSHLPSSPVVEAKAALARHSSPSKEVEKVATCASIAEKESKTFEANESSVQTAVGPSNLSKVSKTSSVDLMKNVPEPESIPRDPPTAISNQKNAHNVEEKIEEVREKEKSSLAISKSLESIKRVEEKPISPVSENEHVKSETSASPTKIIDSISEPVAKAPSPQTTESSSTRVQKVTDTKPENLENDSGEHELDAIIPVKGKLVSKPDEKVKENKPNECAINETENQVTEDVTEKPVSVTDKSLPIDETTVEPVEVVENVLKETHKTDNNEQKTTNMETTLVKSKKIESRKQPGRSTRGSKRQLSEETDAESVHKNENSRIEQQTEKEVQVTQKSRRNAEKTTESKKEVKPALLNEKVKSKADEIEPPARKQPINEIVRKEADKSKSSTRKETKKDERKKDANVPETVVPQSDTLKEDSGEVEEIIETRRTTRSSSTRKNDVEVASENTEKSKKLLKNIKPKNEKNEVQVPSDDGEKSKKSSKNIKQKDDTADVEISKKSTEKEKKLPKNVKKKNETEAVETLKITIRTTRSRTNGNEKETLTVKQGPVGKSSDEAGSDAKADEEQNEESADDNEGAELDETKNENDEPPKKEVKKYAKKGKKKKRSYVKKSAKPKKENQSEDEADAKEVKEMEPDVKDDISKAGTSKPNEETAEVVKTPEPKKKKLKRGWLHELDVSNITENSATDTPGIRQSRRIAQLKIKEQAENKYQEPISSTKKSPAKTPVSTKKTKMGKGKSVKFKSSNENSEDETYYEIPASKKKRKKKKDQQPKKNFDPKKAWKQSSESSSEEEEEEDHFEEEDEEAQVIDRSDHEFSPESDLEDDDYQPVKRARTAHSKPRVEDKSERDDLACQSCGTAEQPEWILLCDSCDEGWHAACLKPPVMAIPEGDWFCPPCQHNKLINGLRLFLRTYDKAVKKRANEESRRKRLEFVNISFSNIIDEESSTKREARQQSSSSNDESSEEESEEDEPLYQLRVRRQANVRHRLNEYEELMNSAIERENGDIPALLEPVATETNVNCDVKETSNIVETPETKEETKKENEESAEDEEDDAEEAEKGEDEEEGEKKEKVAPVLLQLRNVRKKPQRLTNLDVSSEDDHYSDEDFKGSSADDQEEDDEYAKSETDSDEASYRRRGRREPVRRSTRARRTRYDNDFINDNSDDDEDGDGGYSRKSKSKRVRYSESDSDDSTWGRRKRNKSSQSHRAKPAKRRRRIKFDGDSDDEIVVKKKKSTGNSRIKYGLDEEDDFSTTRRTRGKKISYQDDLDSEFEEEEESSKSRNKSRKVVSDDEYMDEEDEQKDSVASENGEHNESGSESNESGKTKTTKKSKILESDDSDSAPASSSKPQEAEAKEPSTVAGVGREPDQSSVNMEVDVNVDKTKSASPLPSDIAKVDPEIHTQKIDQNPSLQGMQSMAQNLSQPLHPNQFPPNVHPDVAALAARHPQPAPIPVNYELGIRYETPEGMPLGPPQPGDKFPHPIRVPSPNKVYGLPDMQAGNRPHLPPFPPPQMHPSLVGPPPIMTTVSLPQSSRPMPPAIPISQMQMTMARQESSRPMPSSIPISQGSIPIPESSRPMPPAIPISQMQMSMSVPESSRPMPPAIPIPRGPMALPGPMHPRPPHLAQPPPNVNIAQCRPPGPMIPPNTMPPTTETTSTTPKRRPRGRGKKQLEMERLQREREAMEVNRNEEMIPIHVLKMPPPEPNAAGHSTMPPRPPFTVYQQMTYPPAPTTVLSANSSSKRVKITPTRMRMPTPSDKIMHIPRPPNSSAGLYPPVRHPPVSISSSPSGVPSPDSKAGGPPVSGAPTTPTLPVKSEAGTARSESSEPQYYQHPPTPYPPSQGPRVYGPRPEYTFARKPAPPGVYQSPVVNTAPNVVVSRTGGFASASGPTPVSSSNMKSESPTTATNTGATVPQPYPAQYGMPPRGLPTTVSPSVVSKPGQGGPYIMSTAQPPRPLPPVSVGYPVHSHSSAGTPPYAAPFYTRPAYPPAPAPPPSSQPSVTFSHTMPTQTFPPNQTTTIRMAHPQSPSRPSSSETNTLNSLPPTSQSDDYQFPQRPPTESVPETETASEENPPPEETSSGEFGGLVSYFSSQHEDDLDG